MGIILLIYFWIEGSIRSVREQEQAFYWSKEELFPNAEHNMNQFCDSARLAHEANKEFDSSISNAFRSNMPDDYIY